MDEYSVAARTVDSYRWWSAYGPDAGDDRAETFDFPHILGRSEEASMLPLRACVVISGSVVIVEPDPTVASIWTEVSAYAGFQAEVVQGLTGVPVKRDIAALIVRVSADSDPVPAEWRMGRRPRLIALVTPDCGAPGDLNDFDDVLPCDGQVHALYETLHRLARSGPGGASA